MASGWLPALAGRSWSGTCANRARFTPWVACLAFSLDSQRLVTACGDGSAYVWSLRGGAPVVLRRHKERRAFPGPAPLSTATFTPDGQRVILADGDGGVVRLWDARTGEAEGELKGKALGQAWFSPDGRLAFLSGQVWDIDADEAVSPRPLHSAVTSAAFSPDGARLLTAGTDGTARLWNLAGGLPRQPPFKHDWPSVMARRATPEEPQPGNSREGLYRA